MKDLVKIKQLEMEMTMAYLGKERLIWLGAKSVAETEPCGETLEAVKTSSMRLDYLLDELGAQQTGL